MEYFDICDENGIPTGQTISRAEAHSTDALHRTAHIWIIREKKGRVEVLLQRRSKDKDSFPDCLDTSSAGHIQAGDEPLESAIRELGEELGIRATAEELTFIGNYRIHYAKEFYGKMFRDNEVVYVYLYEKMVDTGKLKLQAEEVSGVEWHDLEETVARVSAHEMEYCVPLDGLMVLNDYLKREKRV